MGKENKFSVINYIGSNATGKSTRVTVLVNYLESKYDVEDVEFTYTKKSKKYGDKEVTTKVGLRFSNDWVIFGKFDGSRKWIGLDTGMCSSWDQRSAFITEMKERGVDTVVFEGYFNNRSKIAGPETFHNAGADEVHILASFYDKCEDFLMRTNIRSGKLERGMDWAENAPGWKDNQGIINSQKYWNEQAKEFDTVDRVSIDAPKEYLVTRFVDGEFDVDKFYETFEVPSEKVEPSGMDEWI